MGFKVISVILKSQRIMIWYLAEVFVYCVVSSVTEDVKFFQ